MFTPSVISAFKAHAAGTYPNEACGLVINGQYQPQENIAANPREQFEISPTAYPLDDSLQAILHSHTNGLLQPSREDIAGQMATAVPWGIATASPERISKVLWWGHGVTIPPLVGRQYRHGPSGTDGKGDCYALIRDYFHLEKGIDIPEFARTDDWWTTGGNMYVENFQKAGFERISQSELQPGDVFLMTSRSRVPNHGGIYLGRGMGLHHLTNYLSREEPLDRYRRLMTHFLRYVGKQGE